MSFNKVILVGNLTRAPELKYTANKGTALVKTGIAVNRITTINGERQEETCFIDLTFWGRTAEVANQYLQKGSKILVEGRLVLEQWQDQNGQNRSRHSITVDTMEMLDKKEQNNDGGYGQGGGYNQGYQGGGYNNNQNGHANQNSYNQNSGSYGNQGGGYNQNSHAQNANSEHQSRANSQGNQNSYGAQNPRQNPAQNTPANTANKQAQENLPEYDVDNDEIPF